MTSPVPGDAKSGAAALPLLGTPSRVFDASRLASNLRRTGEHEHARRGVDEASRHEREAAGFRCARPGDHVGTAGGTAFPPCRAQERRGRGGTRPPPPPSPPPPRCPPARAAPPPR